jgi:hypothetical protein
MDPFRHDIAKLIKQADHFILHRDWDQAASRCYQILALDLDNVNATLKLTSIYLQRELVEDMRLALQRLFAPQAQDASPYQQRRMLAFSYRVLSCWKGWLRDDFEQTPPVNELEEVSQILNHAYLRGGDDDLLKAWNIYVTACANHARAKYLIQWWVVKQYAEHGFFADAAEVLCEMRCHCPEDQDARYVLAEMRWWRDHADTLIWLP